MDARYAPWLESAVDSAAAAILAAAAGYAAIGLGSSPIIAGASAAATLLAGLGVLRSVSAGSPRFSLRPFDLAPFPTAEQVDELVLTESDRLGHSAASDGTGELVLDDVLARLEDFSRVVRLFDRSAMPTPGELKARVDHHLEGSPPPSAPPDASQALHDALCELRRTLR